MNKRTDDFYMADNFNRGVDLAYCTAACDSAIGAVKGMNTITADSISSSSWEPMATVVSVDKLNDKVVELIKTVDELQRSFEAVNSKPLRALRSELRTLDARRYNNDYTRAM
jgi:hypothetical protein